ncbi:hypothetical protein GLOIN_2v1875900 [Rhizophagus clarus]|uniref:Uncharacterized protein n=1 Tax=Rhizophagus clarus TaxID=94130 RepID=A0A8H3QYX7_9GLOM|nr:hypothetical protein GLOIN_2v1875900 [Rhizophagus clarus]
MEKQLQNNTNEMIPEEAPEELEQEMDVDGEEEVITQPVASDKRSANEDIDSSSRKKSKKDEKRGLHREAVREVESDWTLFDLYLEISNAEERNECASSGNF